MESRRWQNWGWPCVSWAALLCFFGLLFARRQHQIRGLEERKRQLETQQAQALGHRDQLLSRLGDQEDSSKIELALMERLGLVPEGWTKVYFAPSQDQAAK
jgi:hypothetical protein